MYCNPVHAVLLLHYKRPSHMPSGRCWPAKGENNNNASDLFRVGAGRGRRQTLEADGKRCVWFGLGRERDRGIGEQRRLLKREGLQPTTMQLPTIELFRDPKFMLYAFFDQGRRRVEAEWRTSKKGMKGMQRSCRHATDQRA